MSFRRFQYQVVIVDTRGWSGGIVDEQETTDVLNEMGAQGWELVSTATTHMGQGATRCIIHYFKREV